MEEKYTQRSLFEKFNYKNALLLFLVLISFWVSSYESMKLFHFITEGVIILLCYSIVVITKNTFYLGKNQWLKYFGVCFFSVLVFECLHLFFCNNLDLFVYNTTVISYAFDMSESYITSLALFFYLGFSYKKYTPLNLFKIFLIIPIMLLLLIISGLIPIYFIPNNTGINYLGELGVLLIYIVDLVIIYKRRKVFQIDHLWFVCISIILDIFSKIFSLININAYNISIVLSHYFKYAALYMLYIMIVNENLSEPVRILTKEVYEQNEELEATVEELDKQNKKLLEAEEVLRDRERVYRMVIEKIPMPTYLRQDDYIIFANEALARLFKAPRPEELLGIEIYDLIHPDCHKAVRKVLEEAKGNPIIGFSEKMIDFNKNVIDVEVTNLPILTSSGPVQMVIITDMTAIKKSELMVQALKDAKENERLCTEFFANLSHEFRTPINVIYSSCQLIEMYIEKGQFDDIDKYNKIVKHNCYRVSKLINNLIDSNRISEGFYQISPKNVDFIAVVEDTVLSVSPYIEDHGMEIVFDTDVEEKPMLCDPEKIERVILNLLSNSVKYKRESGGKVEVKVFDRGETVEVVVKDNGLGISKEKISSVFNRFVKIDKSFSRTREGSGLGLYIVKSLVEMHKGTITVQSEEGLGTEFHIKLPVVTTEDVIEFNDLRNTRSLEEKVKIEFSDVYDFE